MNNTLLVGIACFLPLAVPVASVAQKKAIAPGTPLTYENHVRPILKAHCFECHGESKKPRGGLDLRLRRLMVEGGETGPAIEPGKRDESLLFERVLKHEMPPGKVKLKKGEIEIVGRWIAEGAKTAKPEPEDIAPGLFITEEERAFWAFQPITRAAPPKVKNGARVRNPIDAFLLAKLEEKGLSLAPEADRRTLIRRATFDLLGLPPTPEEVEAFVKDTKPEAFERLVDRLLASPHYGERWGRHWLDVAGYADSDGYSSADPVRPYAYKYRDYVIRAFNNDMPFDQFIVEQLAGDELVRPPYDKLSGPDLDKLIATGFLRMAPDGTGVKDVDVKLASNQVIADTIQIVSTSLMGLTMHCAQCHNHRYDPIPQTDYYQLRAIFEPALDWKSWRAPPARLVALLSVADRKRAEAIEKDALAIDRERLKKEAEHIERTFQKELAKLPEELQPAARAAHSTPVAKRTAAQKKLMQAHPSLNVTSGSLYLYDGKAAAELKAFAAKSAALRTTKPAPDFVHALTEIPGKVPATHLFHRGDHEQPKEVVAPGGLTILAGLNLGEIPDKSASLPTTGRRLALAQQLTSGKHPLVARVIVNRVWMHHFGRGIVATPGDFGFLGERPTHPELLDWLALEFVEKGWSVKKLHRLMMTSAAYGASAKREAKDIDPDNRLFGRSAVRRLDAEAIRDAILSVSGKLNTKRFGPPVPVMVDEVGQAVIGVDTRDGAGRPTGKFVPIGADEFRRSVYVQVRRSLPLAVLETFDAANPSPNCEIRTPSTVTPQALMLMNSKFMVDQAGHFADRLRREAGDNPRAQVALAWRFAFGTEPSASEVDSAVAFLNEQAKVFQRQQQADGQRQALATFCQALLSSNRFLYVE
jgi:mono/diheme cytochrome c family protein